MEFAIKASGFSAIFFVFAIFFFVFSTASEFIFEKMDFVEFLTSPEWYPTSLSNKRYGTLALLAGTVSVTGLAMLIAVPLGLGSALFISEFTSGAVKEGLKITIELLAAIPSVVWGFIGLAVMNPLIIEVFDAPIGLNVLNGGIILGLMSVPIIVSIGEDALKAVPDSYREESLALGATRWQTIRRIVLPNSISGILTGVILEVSRTVGETAPIMFTGAAFFLPFLPASVFDQTMAMSLHLYTISTQVPGVPEALPYGVALALILIVLVLNSVSIAFRTWLRGRKKW